MASYPDFPAGSARCHVIKLFAAKNAAPIIKALATLGFPAPEPITAYTLRTLSAAVSEERWAAVEQAKQRSPVWGPTPDDFTVEPAQTRLTRWLRDLGNPWRKYRLHGDQARKAIERALH